ncbi:ion transporter [Cryomorpha ignava]|uniref:Ion transporter n=1 Tax=Cryomorpha ignava TaxID=101383 RepID=A0A7K3WRQ9_9FLAO|nr:ion transporter [Cryomorpha ignava]NEN24206.1 ion transporter [Cryomorpha ignava]
MQNTHKLSYKRKKYRALYKLEAGLEIPMFILSLLWLYLLIVDLVKGLGQIQNTIFYIIWGIFIFEYILKLYLAASKWTYIKQNWITLLALIIPAFRVFRLLNAIRILRSASFISSTNVLRSLTSGRRFLTALKEAKGPQPEPEMNIGILIEYSKKESKEELKQFAEQLILDVMSPLQAATGIPWSFDITDPSQLATDKARRPSDFLDDTSLRMAEGPYDMMLVITDVALATVKNRVDAGFTSSVARIAMISTRKLVTTGRKQPMLSLNDESVRYNAAALFLHLVGEILELSRTKKGRSKIMSTFEFIPDRKSVPAFTQAEIDRLHKNNERLPERELRGGNGLESFMFHLLMAFRHPKQLIKPILRNRAILLPLSLPKLVTAAVSPSFILLFTAEIWDVGINMPNSVAIMFAVMSIMGASFYLVTIQSLFLPRKEKRILTEHLAVANTTIYLSIFLACIGLFLMVGLLMLFMELYVFPGDLIQTWPTLNKQAVELTDLIRLAAFISTVGVTTGALAGGFESRAVIRELSLFKRQK